ncbi:MAG: hypothetical protein NVSMB6_28810 [Burkholderiaceae bacterium]
MLSFAMGMAEALPIIKAALAAKTIGLIIGFSLGRTTLRLIPIML